MAPSSKVSAATLPPLRVTSDDDHELRGLCTDLENELLVAYEEYLYAQGRHVDPQRWKPVRSKDDMHVYRERRAFKHTSSASVSSNGSGSKSRITEFFSSHNDSHSNSSSSGPVSSSSRSEFGTTLEIGPMHAMAASSNMPIVMVAGSAPGTVSDALYGVTLTDTPSVRTRNIYQKEKLQDCAVLATLDSPTFEDPFQFRGIVWFLKDYPVINTIVKPRDLLQLVNVHQTQTSRGEPIGVALYHSITHRDLPELTEASIIRVQNSLSVVFRQLDDQRIEIFMMNFVDPMGKVPEMFVTQDLAQALITSTNLPNSGLKKKLHFLMRTRQRQRSLSSDNFANKSDKPNCVSCDKVLGRMLSGNGSVCQLCHKLACSKCRVTKKIVVEATATTVSVRPFDFCLGCIMTARSTSAAAISRSEHDLRRPLNYTMSASILEESSVTPPPPRLIDLL